VDLSDGCFSLHHLLSLPEGTLEFLRTNNPLESIFSGVRLQTDTMRRVRRCDNVLSLIFKIAEQLTRNWRSLDDGANRTPADA